LSSLEKGLGTPYRRVPPQKALIFRLLQQERIHLGVIWTRNPPKYGHKSWRPRIN